MQFFFLFVEYANVSIIEELEQHIQQSGFLFGFMAAGKTHFPPYCRLDGTWIALLTAAAAGAAVAGVAAAAVVTVFLIRIELI